MTSLDKRKSIKMMKEQDLDQFSDQEINNILKLFKEYDNVDYIEVNKLVKPVPIYQSRACYPEQPQVDLQREEGVSLKITYEGNSIYEWSIDGLS